MKLFEIKNTKSKGTYAGMRFTSKTIKKINSVCKQFDIKNKTKNSDFHSTLLFSRKHLPDYLPLGKLDDIIVGNAVKCNIWPTQGDNPKQALVLQFKCKELSARHKSLMDEHKGSWDFPSYIPHLTLSYDCGDDFDIKGINKFIKDKPFDIEMDKEYQEDLDLDWGK